MQRGRAQRNRRWRPLPFYRDRHECVCVVWWQYLTTVDWHCGFLRSRHSHLARPTTTTSKKNVSVTSRLDGECERMRARRSPREGMTVELQVDRFVVEKRMGKGRDVVDDLCDAQPSQGSDCSASTEMEFSTPKRKRAVVEGEGEFDAPDAADRRMPPSIKAAHKRWKDARGREVVVNEESFRSAKASVCRRLYQTVRGAKESSTICDFFRELLEAGRDGLELRGKSEPEYHNAIQRKLYTMFETLE